MISAKRLFTRGFFYFSLLLSLAVFLSSPLPEAQSQNMSVISADPTTAAVNGSTGQWSAPVTWPIKAVHVSVLPNGRVLVWSRDKISGCNPVPPDLCDVEIGTQAQIWNPSNGTFAPVPLGRTNLFCSGHSFLPDGRLLVTGGHLKFDLKGQIHANIFDYRNNSWSPAPNMNAGRWYPSNCTLANGEVLVAAGLNATGQPNNIPQVWTTSGGWRNLQANGLPLYPFLHLAPDGRVFVSGPQVATQFLVTSGGGQWTPGPPSRTGFRDYGSSVMYDDGKILIVGGGDARIHGTAEAINLNRHGATWRQLPNMAFARRQLNATILADGKVLVTGGTSGGMFSNAIGSVFAAELWDPVTERWATMASCQIRRLYHSTAVLLPDGRVLSAGGGLPAGENENTGGENAFLYGHSDMEIYLPPYFFKGARPTITSAPDSVAHGQTFAVGTPDAASIADALWVSLPSVTHAFNQNQRINYLIFSGTGASSLNITAPASSNLCPPGYYMLFLVNSNGVPSIAKIIRVTTPASPGSAIDDARYFARQQYYDLLNREADKPSLQGWARQIVQCGGNAACREQKRVEVSRGFWDSAEFKQKNPAVVNPGGNPAFRNPEFIRLCYLYYLGRAADTGGFNSWLNDLNTDNNYNRVIKGFITSQEYLNRFRKQ